MGRGEGEREKGDGQGRNGEERQAKPGRKERYKKVRWGRSN